MQPHDRQQRFDLVGRRRDLHEPRLAAGTFEPQRQREVPGTQSADVQSRGQAFERRTQQKRQRLEGIDRIATLDRLFEAGGPRAWGQRTVVLAPSGLPQANSYVSEAPSQRGDGQSGELAEGSDAPAPDSDPQLLGPRED